jgi:hypothetical protein
MTIQENRDLMTATFWEPYCYECRDTGGKYYTGYREDCRKCGGHIKELKQRRDAENEWTARSREIAVADWATEAERKQMVIDLMVN